MKKIKILKFAIIILAIIIVIKYVNMFIYICRVMDITDVKAQPTPSQLRQISNNKYLCYIDGERINGRQLEALFHTIIQENRAIVNNEIIQENRVTVNNAVVNTIDEIPMVGKINSENLYVATPVYSYDGFINNIFIREENSEETEEEKNAKQKNKEIFDRIEKQEDDRQKQNDEWKKTQEQKKIKKTILFFLPEFIEVILIILFIIINKKVKK